MALVPQQARALGNLGHLAPLFRPVAAALAREAVNHGPRVARRLALAAARRLGSYASSYFSATPERRSQSHSRSRAPSVVRFATSGAPHSSLYQTRSMRRTGVRRRVSRRRLSRGRRTAGRRSRGVRSKGPGMKTALNPQYQFQFKKKWGRGAYRPPLGRLVAESGIPQNGEVFSVKHKRFVTGLVVAGLNRLSTDIWGHEACIAVQAFVGAPHLPYYTSDFFRAMDGWEEFKITGSSVAIAMRRFYNQNATYTFSQGAWSAVSTDQEPHVPTVSQYTAPISYVLAGPPTFGSPNGAQVPAPFLPDISVQTYPSLRMGRTVAPFTQGAVLYPHRVNFRRTLPADHDSIQTSAGQSTDSWNVMSTATVPGGVRNILWTQRPTVMRWNSGDMLADSFLPGLQWICEVVVTTYFRARHRSPLAPLVSNLANVTPYVNVPSY